MKVSEFYFIVLPLGILVCTLALLVFFYARREELAQWKLKRQKHAYARKRLKQKETHANEIEKLKVLLRSGSIDETTYERLKEILRISYQKNHEEALAQLVPLLEKSDAHRKERG